MKFAKALLIAAALSPTVAVAQGTPPVEPSPTNFVFVPALLGFFAVPFVLGDNNDAVPILPPPSTLTPVVSTR